MNHDAARAIFNEIRDRPYGVSSAQGVAYNNCYYKGIELLQRLGILGYTVRGQIGIAYWNPALFPADVLALMPADFPGTHFWCEVTLDGTWVPLDPSFDPPLARTGLPVREFGDGKLCFEITKTFTQDENITYKKEWADPQRVAAYYASSTPFLAALNAFFEKGRA